MLEQEKSGKSGFVGIFFVLLAVVLYVFLGRGFASNRAEVQANFDLKSQELEKLRNQEVEIDRAKDELKLTSTVEQFTSLAAVPAGLNQDEVIRNVIEVADSYDISLNAINFSRSNSNLEGIGVLKINASFEANYGDLIDFLQGLEDSERLFKVSSINVQISDTGISGLSKANFSLSIDTFYQL